MARNRKSQSAAIRFGPAIKALVICLLLGGSGIGYVWQKEQISKLGQQIKIRETRLDSVKDQNDKLRKQVAKLLSPPALEMRIKDLNLGLVPQQPAQVWRLPEPVASDWPEAERPEAAPTPGSREYALRSGVARGGR
jgi:cell division protein FtsB